MNAEGYTCEQCGGSIPPGKEVAYGPDVKMCRICAAVQEIRDYVPEWVLEVDEDGLTTGEMGEYHPKGSVDGFRENLTNILTRGLLTAHKPATVDPCKGCTKDMSIEGTCEACSDNPLKQGRED